MKTHLIQLPVLTLMVGYPRSGKSIEALKIAKKTGACIVSSDMIRKAIHGRAYIQSAEPYVHAIERTMVESLFLAGHEAVILDSCHNTRKRRDPWKSKLWRREFVTIDTPEDVCYQRIGESAAECIAGLRSTLARMVKQHEPVEDEEWQ